MSRLETVITLILIVSLVANVGFFIYTRSILSRLLFVSEELGDLQQMTQAFANHLESVYSLETFYGDQTLGSLLEHAASFNEQLETFEFIYSITEEDTNNDTTENTPPPPESEAQQE